MTMKGCPMWLHNHSSSLTRSISDSLRSTWTPRLLGSDQVQGAGPTAGVGGLSGAGYGNLMRTYGTSVDNVVDAQIVDVHGRLLNRSSTGPMMSINVHTIKVLCFKATVSATICLQGMVLKLTCCSLHYNQTSYNKGMLKQESSYK